MRDGHMMVHVDASRCYCTSGFFDSAVPAGESACRLVESSSKALQGRSDMYTVYEAADGDESGGGWNGRVGHDSKLMTWDRIHSF